MPIVWADYMNDTDESLLSDHTPDGGGGPWTNFQGTTPPRIDTAQFVKGSSSCRLHATGEPPVETIRWEHEFTGQNINVAYFAFRMSAMGSWSKTEFALLKASGGINVAMFVSMDDSLFKYSDLTTIYSTGHTAVANTWYYNKIEFNTSTKLYTWYVKGGAWADWTAFCTDKAFYSFTVDDNIGSMWISTVNVLDPEFDCFFDDIHVGDEIIGVFPAPAGSLCGAGI